MNACSPPAPGFSRIVPLQIQVLAPIHGQDGPCHCLQVPNLLQGLHLLRYLPGALLQLNESNGTQHTFSVGDLRFLSCGGGTDTNLKLLFSHCENLHQDVELIRTETRAAFDSARESWYEWLDWHNSYLAAISVSPRPVQGEMAEGECVATDQAEPEQAPIAHIDHLFQVCKAVLHNPATEARWKNCATEVQKVLDWFDKPARSVEAQVLFAVPVSPSSVKNICICTHTGLPAIRKPDGSTMYCEVSPIDSPRPVQGEGAGGEGSLSGSPLPASEAS